MLRITFHFIFSLWYYKTQAVDEESDSSSSDDERVHIEDMEKDFEEVISTYI